MQQLQIEETITLLKEVDQTWLLDQLYASELLSLEQTKASDLTALYKVLEKDSDGSKFHKLINILRKDSANEVKANILQTKYSKNLHTKITMTFLPLTELYVSL